mgnify:FL=1
MEVELIPEGLPENLLKLISVDGSSDAIPSLSKILKPGSLFKVLILESFPEKNKAIVKISNKRLMVETQHVLKPGYSFNASVYKTSPKSPLQIKLISSKPETPLQSLEDKTELSEKKQTNFSSKKVLDGKLKPISKDFRFLPRNNNFISTAINLDGISNVDLKEFDLLPGQIIKATVINVSGENYAIVKVNNKPLTAYFPFELPKPGEMASIVVTAHGENFKLIAEQKNVKSEVEFIKIKALLPFKEQLGEMIQKLHVLINSSEVIKKLTTESDLVGRLTKTLNLFKMHALEKQLPVQNSSQLKEQIDLSGVNYESKLKSFLEGEEPFKTPFNIKSDLKGLLINLLKVIETIAEDKDNFSSQRRHLMDVINIVRRAVDNIELQQVTNQVLRQEGQPILLQIPDPFMIGKTINLYLKKNDSNGEGKNDKDNVDVLLVFLLNLSALGNLRVDAKMNKELISIKIDVESQDIANFIDSHLKEFSAGLEEMGFEVNASCFVVRKIVDNLGQNMSQLLISNSERLVDLTT